jgi:predicted transcriptional regulator YdeE
VRVRPLAGEAVRAAHAVQGTLAVQMEPHHAVRPEMHVLGRRARTSNALERDPATARIGRLWAEAPALAGVHGADRLRAVYFDYEGDHEAPYTIVVGVEVPEPVEPDDGLTLVTAPAADCLVFPARGPLPEAVVDAWREVWEAFPAGTAGRAYSHDVEVYGPEGADLYIAVRPGAKPAERPGGG